MYDYDLRRIIHPEREQAVTQSPADHHGGIFHGIQPAVVFWEESLIRCKNATDPGQPELSSVGMTGKHQIHSCFCVQWQQVWLVGQQNRIQLIMLQCFQTFGKLMFRIFSVKGDIIHAQKLNLLPILLQNHGFIPQDGYPSGFQTRFQL